jgi:hypothetical protein
LRTTKRKMIGQVTCASVRQASVGVTASTAKRAVPHTLLTTGG